MNRELISRIYESEPNTDLQDVELRGEDLQGVHFPAGANLREMDLRGTDFRSANLQGADLRGVDLTDCCINRCTSLDGALMEGAKILFPGRMGRKPITL